MKEKKPQPSEMAAAITRVIADFISQKGLIFPEESKSKYLTNGDIIPYILELTGRKYAMSTIDRWRAEGKIPFHKSASGGIFYEREAINVWLSPGMKNNIAKEKEQE